MAKKWLISAAYAVSGVALLGLTGCGGSAPDDGYGGPGPSAYEESRGSGELMGGKAPPPPPADGLAGGPAVRGMAAIPNPENLPLEERRRIYGNRYDHLKYKPLPGARDYAKAGSKTPGAPLRSYRNADGILVVHNAPIANPEDMSPAERRRIYGKRYAPRPQSGPRRDWTVWKPKPKAKPAPRVAAAPAYKPAPAPKAVAAPKPVPKVAAAPAPKPVVKPAPAPVKVAPPVAVAKAAPAPAPVIKPAALPPVAKAPAAPAVDPKMAALSTAVSAEAIKGATLTVPDTLAQGQESKVTLSLPVNLLDVIQKEAAKLGLTKAARKSDVSATLTGEGYTITPNAAQTQSLKKGEAATFNWQVKPGDGEKTPLKATVEGALKGQKGAPKTFSIATLEQVVANAVESGESQAKKLGFNLDKLAIPGLKPIKIGDTVIPPGATTAGIIAFVIALILLAMARAGSSRRAREERRRKYRTMTDYGRAEPEAAPEPDHHQPVNPMLAAAGGAAAGAGAAAMTFGHHDDEHGHAEASHEAHGHDAHGHDAHAADHHSDTAPMTFHSEDAHADHGHGAHAAEAHGHDAHAAHAVSHAHDDHGHGEHAPAAHDDHAHDAHAAPAAEAHGHDDHGHAADAHDEHGHAADTQGHDDHGHAAHDDHHHREPEHA